MISDHEAMAAALVATGDYRDFAAEIRGGTSEVSDELLAFLELG